MNRQNFLRIVVSALASIPFIGFDHEKLSIRWLEKNGFVMETKQVGHLTRAIVYHPKFGLAGAMSLHLDLNVTPEFTPAYSYLFVLKRRNFTIEQNFIETELIGEPDADWKDVKMITREVSPPIIHRFDPPWWV